MASIVHPILRYIILKAVLFTHRKKGTEKYISETDSQVYKNSCGGEGRNEFFFLLSMDEGEIEIVEGNCGGEKKKGQKV
jgi:hypothetical protein